MNSSYTVTPSLSGHAFGPSSLAVTVNGANMTTANFTAALPLGVVQTATNISDNGGTTISQAFSTGTSAGNLIVVTASWGSHAAAPTVSDTQGNTYVQSTSAYSAAGDQSLAIYYAKNIVGGSNTVTINFWRS